MRGLSPGETRRVRIEPANAYGSVNKDLVVSLPRDRVPAGVTLQEGQRVPLSNGMSAKVLEISDSFVLIDANHELAGKILNFEMELVSFEEKVLQPPQNSLERAIFALGCFWGKH